jgi:hypothetical protein
LQAVYTDTNYINVFSTFKRFREKYKFSTKAAGYAEKLSVKVTCYKIWQILKKSVPGQDCAGLAGFHWVASL